MFAVLLAATIALPPPRYDYKPRNVEVRRVDMGDIRRFCGKRSIGCAAVKGSKCFVIVPTKGILDRKTYKRLLRHEYAHCNGWSHK